MHTVNFLIAATLYFAAAWLENAPSAGFLIWHFYIWHGHVVDFPRLPNLEFGTRILARFSLTDEMYLSNASCNTFPARQLIFVCIFIFRVGAPEFFPASQILDLAFLYLAEALFETARQI